MLHLFEISPIGLKPLDVLTDHIFSVLERKLCARRNGQAWLEGQRVRHGANLEMLYMIEVKRSSVRKRELDFVENQMSE